MIVGTAVGVVVGPCARAAAVGTAAVTVIVIRVEIALHPGTGVETVVVATTIEEAIVIATGNATGTVVATTIAIGTAGGTPVTALAETTVAAEGGEDIVIATHTEIGIGTVAEVATVGGTFLLHGELLCVVSCM